MRRNCGTGTLPGSEKKLLVILSRQYLCSEGGLMPWLDCLWSPRYAPMELHSTVWIDRHSTRLSTVY